MSTSAPRSTVSGADHVEWPADAIEVGRIGEAWGIKGWFRVHPFASDPQALFSSKRWYLQPPEPGALKRPVAPSALSTPLPSLLRIVQAKEHGDGVVAQAHDVDGRAQAEALRGARIFVPRASFPTADPDEYYWVDLIGLDVHNRDGVALGRVLGLIETGPHAVLRIGPADRAVDAAEEVLIPFVGAFVDSVSLDAKRIVVDWALDD